MTKYTTGITTYDEDKELFGTDVGEVNSQGVKGNLFATVWGNSEEDSKQQALGLELILNNLK
jgi:hypothetical protein